MVKRKFKISYYRLMLERALEVDTAGRIDSVLKLSYGSFVFDEKENCFFVRYEVDKKRERGVFAVQRLSDVSLRLLCVYVVLKSLHYSSPVEFDFSRFGVLSSRESMVSFLGMLSSLYSKVLLFGNVFGCKPSQQSFFQGVFYRDFFSRRFSFYEVGRHCVVDLLNCVGWSESDVCRVTRHSLNLDAFGWYFRELGELYAPVGFGWFDVVLLSGGVGVEGFFGEGLVGFGGDVLLLLKK